MDFSHQPFLSKLQDFQKKAQKDIATVYEDHLHIDPWSSDLGMGYTGVCQGRSLEKAAVSISCIKGSSLPPSATLARPDLKGCSYQVTGLSIILHPYSPLIPTAHGNIRKFSVYKDDQCIAEWFGGGVDLTPYIYREEESQKWHSLLREYVIGFEPELYQQWKDDCDRYFFLKHRDEPRGIGGIFFDDYPGLESGEITETVLIDLMHLFLKENLRLAQQYRLKAFDATQKDFQLWRRGRYVEFNLLFDRGTLFGLQSGGRTEAILLSLPPQVSWIYKGDEIHKKNNDLLVSGLRSCQSPRGSLKKDCKKIEKDERKS